MLAALFKEIDLRNAIVMGDLNIRKSTLQKNIEENVQVTFEAGMVERKSKAIVVNAKGWEFKQLSYNHGLVIMNGMVKGDREGEFTFISGAGTSVNDICAVAQDFLRNVSNFNVESQIWSDHLPIALDVQINVEENEHNIFKLLPKLQWRDKYLDEYQMKVLAEMESAKINTDLTEIQGVTNNNNNNNNKTKMV